MASSIEIQPVSGPLNAIHRPPGSKSITNRALLCAAFATGTSVLSGVLKSDDTQFMLQALSDLGIVVEDLGNHTLKVHGCGGQLPTRHGEIFIGNSGTSIRFLTAVLSFAGGNYRLDGIPRMRERPIGDLVLALNELGANVQTHSANRCPPVSIDNEKLTGGACVIRGDVSSQYLSGLMMASPLATEDVQIRIDGPLVSLPYIQMTTKVMQDFGVNCKLDPSKTRVDTRADEHYTGTDFEIEPDASAASYFLAAAAICGGQVTVEGLGADSIQGDIAFAGALEQMGCDVELGPRSISVSGKAMRGIDIVMSDFSDTVQTLSAVALFVSGKTTIRGIAHNRVKETDRIGNLAIELRKLGATVDEFDDGMTITCLETRPASIETYDDHRMAMSLALVGLRQPGVVIQDPECVAKTYPNFFADLEKIC